MTSASNLVCHSQKRLCGLKQAPLCWNLKINHVLVTAGFSRAVSESGVYSRVLGTQVVLVAL